MISPGMKSGFGASTKLRNSLSPLSAKKYSG